MLDPSGTVANLFGGYAHPIQQRQVEVRHRRVFGIDDVIVAAEAAAATDDEDGKVFVEMAIAVAQAAAVDDDRVVQQRTVSIRRLLELTDESREPLPVPRVPDRDLLDPLRVAAVVSERVRRVRHADLRIGP